MLRNVFASIRRAPPRMPRRRSREAVGGPHCRRAGAVMAFVGDRLTRYRKSIPPESHADEPKYRKSPGFLLLILRSIGSLSCDALGGATLPRSAPRHGEMLRSVLEESACIAARSLHRVAGGGAVERERGGQCRMSHRDMRHWHCHPRTPCPRVDDLYHSRAVFRTRAAGSARQDLRAVRARAWG